MNTQINITLLSMTSTVIQGNFYVYFNLNLRSYEHLFVLVFLLVDLATTDKELLKKLILRGDSRHFNM